MEALKNILAQINQLPNNLIAEQSILNILLNNPTLIKNTISILKINAFYNEKNRLIYQSLIELVENDQVINFTTVITKLQDNGSLKKIGGVDKFIEIIETFENFSNLETYIELVNEKYLRRLFIELGKKIIEWNFNTSLNLENISTKIEESFIKLNQQKVTNKIYTSAEIIDNIFTDLKAIKKQQFGYKSFFDDLDSILQGLQPSDLIIVSGRPSMGKTAFSLNIAKNVTENYNIPVIIFSLEMSRQQIIYRFISSEAQVNNNRLKSAKMTSSEWVNLTNSMKKISELPLYIDDNPNLTLNDIRIKLKKIFIEKNETGIVIIDYLQLMKLPVKFENRVQEISYITRNLKTLAKEFNIPIILLSQLSRNVESRINKRPMLSDLRESGCLVKSKKLNYTDINSWNLDQIVKQKSTSFQFKGIKPTYRILFENNIEIELTSNHKILSKKGWIKISELTKNTEIYFLLKKEELINSDRQIKKHIFIKIINIKYQGLNPVYDKTIPVFHNYLIENLILHNSIEQDADIVIMLYREDYYNEKQIGPQITEIIVAKHRNGPVGTAKLLFNPTTTTFQNFT